MRLGIIFGLALAASYRGQTSILVITVVDSAARHPLVNAT
jgi:hypothetical protein